MREASFIVAQNLGISSVAYIGTTRCGLRYILSAAATMPIQVFNTARHVVELGESDGQPIKVGFRLNPACPGGFMMGSRGHYALEEPIHRVVMAEDFWMGETPVTQAQFAVWTRAKGIDHKNYHDGKPDHPAVEMAWHQAKEFCEWLTNQQAIRLPALHRFAMLPTEAQWEYVCRAGTSTEYYSGDGESALNHVGWYAGNSNSTCPVASSEMQANGYGLYDMHGNVWEWCMDRWDAEAYRRRWDGIEMRETYRLNEQFGDQSDSQCRVVRGGSWYYTADGCRSSYRDWIGAGDSVRGYGFRVCLVRSPLDHFRQEGAEPER